tara:strand:+ start:2141 stop:3523 length:1383 start_codon:yes stop_codon:yes gene_type:complete
MALLYSDESRKLLLEKSKKWNKKIKIYNTISYILHNKYLRTDKIYEDYIYFDKIRPEYILKELHKYNSKKFVFDPIKNKKVGFKSALYIRKLYKLLGIKVLFLDYDNYSNKLYYSFYNNVKVKEISNNYIKLDHNFKTKKTIEKYCKDPDIIIIHIDQNHVPYNNYPNDYKFNNEKFKNILINLKNNKENINYNNCEYINDSILLSNWNKSVGGHSIAGITCKCDKYVYNGWTRSTVDPNMKNIWQKVVRGNKVFYYNKFLNKSVYEKDLPSNAMVLKDASIPCELMKYNWNPNDDKDDDFCLNRKKCSLDFLSTMKDLCFSFNKGSRELIYIKKEKNSKINIKKNKCPDGKIINPLTNRCIKIKNINNIPKKSLSKPEKKCPEGKIINPKTGRCIKDINIIPKKSLSKPEKKCSEGKIINPKTGRCINIIPKKSLSKYEKKCPEGKIINPKTGRCIKIK